MGNLRVREKPRPKWSILVSFGKQVAISIFVIALKLKNIKASLAIVLQKQADRADLADGNKKTTVYT